MLEHTAYAQLHTQNYFISMEAFMKVGERNMYHLRDGKKQMPGPVTRSFLGLEEGILGKFKFQLLQKQIVGLGFTSLRVSNWISEHQTLNLIRIIHNVDQSRASNNPWFWINEWG